MTIRRGIFLLLLFAQIFAQPFARYAWADPDGDYRFFERLTNLKVVGPTGEVNLGDFHDLAFDSQGTLYGVVRQNGLAVYDAAKEHWALIDGNKAPIVGDVNRGLVTFVRRADGKRERTELDPARLPAITGYAEQLAIGPDDRVWVTTHDFTVYRRDGESWERIPGLAKSIEIGADGSVYAMHAAEAPAPRRDARKMREIPTTERIQKWNGTGWDILPDVDTYKIRSLAVDPEGVAWIAYDKWANGGHAGSVVARFIGGAWESVSPQGTYMPHGLAVDENGQLWLDVERDWSGDVRTRSLMTWQGDGWRQEFNIQLGRQSHAFDVYAGLPRLGSFGISEGRPRLSDGWIHYPSLTISDLRLSPSGDFWAISGFRKQSFRWHGGNVWSDAQPGEPKAFYPDGEWVDVHAGLPANQRRGSFELITRSDDDRYFGVTMAPPQRAVNPPAQMQTVYLVEGGRSMALGDAFRTVLALAADDKGRAWVHAQPRVSGRPARPALYRWENGAWVGVELPQGFVHNGGLRTGLDSAVVVTGYRTDQPAVGIWREDKWTLVALPPKTSISGATTDREGVVWGVNAGGILHQEGAVVAFKTPAPLPSSTVAVADDEIHRPAGSSAAPEGGQTSGQTSPDEPRREALAALEAAAEPRTDRLIGCWAWSNGAAITVLDNGQAHNGMAPAPWTAKSASDFEIVWPDFVATITLTPDGATMNEQSLFGHLTGQRTGGSGGTFEGVWQLSNGATAIAASDGSYQIGAFRGSWRKASGARRFEVHWPVHDTITLDADGQSLAGSNQFGTFTATRRPCE